MGRVMIQTRCSTYIHVSLITSDMQGIVGLAQARPNKVRVRSGY